MVTPRCMPLFIEHVLGLVCPDELHRAIFFAFLRFLHLNELFPISYQNKREWEKRRVVCVSVCV
jgi:hypothetical protein